MAIHEPNNWQMPTNASVDSYAEIWADEILPIAREAYARVEFRNVNPLAGWTTASLLRVEAIEKPATRSWTLSRMGN